MPLVIVDEATRLKLLNLSAEAELCDKSGRVLGRFTPLSAPIAYEGLEPKISEEELKRREAEPGGRSLAAILADLEKRA